jgi:hypothetical protein
VLIAACHIKPLPLTAPAITAPDRRPGVSAAAERQDVRRRGEVTQIIKLMLLVVVTILLGCGVTHRDAGSAVLSEKQALQLAVNLANAECADRFGEAPFEASNYPISFRNGRWFWGILDVYGVHGFSALVSFDARGDDRKTVVFFSYDQVEPIDPNDER